MSRSTIPVVLLVALGTAACRDAPLAPRDARSPVSDAPAPTATPAKVTVAGAESRVPPVLQPGYVWVTLQVVDGGDPDPTASAADTRVEFTPAGHTPLELFDNGVQDMDARVGYYRVQLPNTLFYSATVTGANAIYSLAGGSKTVSAFVTPTLVSMGGLALQRKPRLTMDVRMDGALVAGQTLKITGPAAFSVTVTDGGPSDKQYNTLQDASDGKLHLLVPLTGAYTVCPVTSPKKYWDADCKSVYVQFYDVEFKTTLNYVQKWSIPGF